MKVRFVTYICVLFCSVPTTGSGANTATEIRREALLAPNGPAGRPLPLVSHWNMGSQGRGWTPQYQLELLAAGHHITIL